MELQILDHISNIYNLFDCNASLGTFLTVDVYFFLLNKLLPQHSLDLPFFIGGMRFFKSEKNGGEVTIIDWEMVGEERHCKTEVFQFFTQLNLAHQSFLQKIATFHFLLLITIEVWQPGTTHIVNTIFEYILKGLGSIAFYIFFYLL